MSLSDDKVIPMTDTFSQIGEIAAPLTKDIGTKYADQLDQEAEALETEAEVKRHFARIIRQGAQS